jgi:hypothetical protein
MDPLAAKIIIKIKITLVVQMQNKFGFSTVELKLGV